MYSVAYPRLPPVADPQAAANAAPFRARPIVQGTPVDEAALAQARLELAHRRSRRDAITDQEIQDAEVRYLAIVADHIAAAYHVVNPINPAQAMQQLVNDMTGLRRELRQLRRELREGFDHVDERFDDVDERFDDVDERLDRLELSRLNDRIRAMNHRIARGAVNNVLIRRKHLHPFVRVRGDDGPGFLVGQPPFVPPASIDLGDLIPQPLFPRSLASIDYMTRVDIHNLAVVMNDNFGIRANDCVGVCRRKLRLAIADHA